MLTSITFYPFGYAPDVDECKEHLACQCAGCSCKNTWGSYECKCKGDHLYIKENDACIGKKAHLVFGSKMIDKKAYSPHETK